MPVPGRDVPQIATVAARDECPSWSRMTGMGTPSAASSAVYRLPVFDGDTPRVILKVCMRRPVEAVRSRLPRRHDLDQSSSGVRRERR